MPSIVSDLHWISLGFCLAATCFACVFFVWLKRRKVTDRLTTFFSPKRSLLCMLGAMLLFIGLFSFLSLQQHAVYHTKMYDLGNMEQTTWNTLHGNVFRMTTFAPYDSRLFIHVEPIFIALAPLYALWQDARMLLLLQVIIVSLGALPLYLLGKKFFNPFIGLLLGCLYLLNPLVHHALLYDFHPVVLGVPALLAAWYFFFSRRLSYAVIFFLVAMLCREDVALMVFLSGCYIAFVQKQRRFGLLVASVGGFWSVYIWLGIFPTFNFADLPLSLTYTSAVASSPFGVLQYAILHPVDVLQRFFGLAHISYLLFLLTPFFFLPFFHARALLLGICSYALIFFHNSAAEIQLGYVHYHILLVIPLFLATAVVGMRKKFRFAFTPALLVAVAISILFIARTYAFVHVIDHEKGSVYTAEKITAAEEARKIIPRNASVVSSNRLGSHIAGRHTLYHVAELKTFNADYVFIPEQADEYCDETDSSQLALSICEGSYEAYQAFIQSLPAQGYLRIFDKDGIFLFQRTR